MTVAPATLHQGQAAVRPALQDAVARLDDSTRAVVSYHLGWCDVDGHPIESAGGKSLRPSLAILSAEAAGGTQEAGIPGAVAVELVHNFSLLHDDLMDRDVQRRHRATVWSVWGSSTAILAGDALLSLAHEVLLESNSPHAPQAGVMLASATRELIRGQVQDLAFESAALVSLTGCIDMAAGKTGALMSASAAIGAVLVGAGSQVVEALSTFGAQLGVAFQLVDDLLGIWGDPGTTGKPVFSDLASRKKTLPVTYAMEQRGAESAELRAWMSRTEPPSEAELPHVATLVDRAGGRQWAIEETARRTRLAEDAICSVHTVERARRELIELGRFLVSREA
ncbi:MAG TPA: polyprenyl synthetase family protein [Kribbella sp.]|nr:polyprenyl synthetase family protein [Kribbella sp.]